jgi:hypothetical protein
MYCSSCGSENQDSAQYCSKCGQKLVFGEEISKTSQNSTFKEEQLSLDSIHWVLVIPIALIIAVLVNKTMSALIALLVVIIGLGIVGYFVKDPKMGALNGGLTGALAFFVGCVFLSDVLSYQGLGSVILMTFIGALAGVVLGGLGGYIEKISST